MFLIKDYTTIPSLMYMNQPNSKKKIKFQVSSCEFLKKDSISIIFSFHRDEEELRMKNRCIKISKRNEIIDIKVGR